MALMRYHPSVIEEPLFRANSESNAQRRKFVRSLARGLEVLRAFRSGESVLGNQQIVARTGLSKATVSRLTYTLTALGYLVYLPELEKYQLGSAILALGYAALSGLTICETARPRMQRLADAAGGSVALGNRDRLSMIYLQHCRSNSNVTLRMDIGTRVPIAQTAMGRAFLMALPESERQILLARIKAGASRRWPEIEKAIKQAHRDYRLHGFCISLGDWQREVWALGAPVVSRDGRTILAVNCCVPALGTSKTAFVEKMGQKLVALAAQLSRDLHGNGQIGAQLEDES